MGFKDWLFPKKCVGCGKIGSYVCNECSVGMWEEEQMCPGCRRNSRYGMLHEKCRSPLAGIVCWWAYEGITRKLIQKIKYGGFYDYLRESSIFNIQYSERPEFFYFDKFLETKPMMVPIPLHKNRLRQRGFNQAELIAREIFGQKLLVKSDLLVRIVDTKQQVGRTREERFQSMKNVFAVNPNIQKPKKVLLIDDVWTTGATMVEAAKVLKSVGVETVWGFVLAR